MHDTTDGLSVNPAEPRRTFLRRASGVAMGGGLALSYGTFALMAGRFLYPAASSERAWHLVAPVRELSRGKTLSYATPAGLRVAISRRGDTANGDGDDDDSFIALSSTCPHLGCRVHWEAHNSRFFCPCHNGVFSPQGEPVSGPPADAGQALPRYPLKVENGLLFIEVAVNESV